MQDEIVNLEHDVDVANVNLCFLDMLGVFAEFETNLREGIAEAKAEGVYKGRKPSIDAAVVRRLQAEGLGPTEIAGTLGSMRPTRGALRDDGRGADLTGLRLAQRSSGRCGSRF